MRILKYILLPVIFCWYHKADSQSCSTDIFTHFNYADVKHILDKNQCNSCHHKSSPINSWHYETYESMFNQSACKTSVIAPGNLKNSLLISKINGGWVECGNTMPPNGAVISSKDLFAIEQWILSGAPEFCIPSFNEINSLLQISSCGDCHNQTGKWNINDYQSLFEDLSGNECKPGHIVTPWNASKSLLYTKLSMQTLHCGDLMPLNRTPLDYLTVAKIRDWINAGANEQARALPVILEALSLLEYDKNNVRLYWETASELNTSYYEVQHSTDGIRFFSIGQVNAKGGVNKKALYAFDFENQRTGFNYYRLKMVDLDNDYTYSQIRVSFLRNTSEVFSVYPNPIGNGQQLVLEWLPVDDRQKVRATLMDFTGKLCFETIIHSGINNISMPALNPGLYYLTIKDYNDRYRVEKIMITGI